MGYRVMDERLHGFHDCSRHENIHDFMNSIASVARSSRPRGFGNNCQRTDSSVPGAQVSKLVLIFVHQTQRLEQ